MTFIIMTQIQIINNQHSDTFANTIYICDALRDLVSIVQLKEHEKHTWRIDQL